MKHLHILLFILSFVVTSCSFPSQDDVENITALTEIYAQAFQNNDAKSMSYILDEDFKDRENKIKQLKYRTLYLKEVSFNIVSFTITESSFLNKTAQGEMIYNFSYTEMKGESLPIITQNKKTSIDFQKGRHNWKIIAMHNDANSGTTVAKETVRTLYHSLDTRIAAINNKDIELFKTILSSKISNRNEVVEELQKSIDTFKDIIYVLKSREIRTITDKEATIVQRYEMRLTLPDGTSQKIPGMSEKLILALEKNVWKIVNGLS